MSVPTSAVPSVALSAAPTTPQLQLLLAEYRSSIVGGTVLGHFAHWRYLTHFRRLDPSVLGHKSIFRFYGAAWGCVYLGVLSALTYAERKRLRAI